MHEAVLERAFESEVLIMSAAVADYRTSSASALVVVPPMLVTTTE